MNVLLTTLSTKPRRVSTYYYIGDSNSINGQLTQYYCDGLLQTEAGTKKILSEVEIDKILVIGSEKTYNQKDLLESSRVVKLDAGYFDDGMTYSKFCSKEISVYRAFKYRISTFLKSNGSEPLDGLSEFEIDHIRRNELVKILGVLLENKGVSLNSAFIRVYSTYAGEYVKGLQEEIEERIKGGNHRRFCL